MSGLGDLDNERSMFHAYDCGVVPHGRPDIDFSTQNHAEALEWARRFYDNRIRAERRPDQFHLRLRRRDHTGWTADRIEILSGGFTAEPYGTVSVGRLSSGAAQIVVGRDEFDFGIGDVFLIADAEHAFANLWSEADCSLVRLPTSALQRVAEEFGHVPAGRKLRFSSRRPMTAAASRRWVQVVHFAERQLGIGDASSDLVAGTTGDLLAASVLTTFPNNLVPESSLIRVHRDLPSTVWLAIDFIERNADLPVRLVDIAAYASVSPRALQLAFREHLAISPMAFLRQHRLTHVHDELTQAVPGDGTSVTDVAARWTFNESSRLITHYRHRYGENPSATLRRSP